MNFGESNYKTHDLPIDERIVPVQRMFPNCHKYIKCCTEDSEFWETLQKRVKEISPKKTYFRITKQEIKPQKPPKGFEGW